MANLSITSSAVLQSASASLQAPFVAAQATTAGRPVFLNASNQWELATAVDGTHGAAIGALVGISANEAEIGQPLTVCTEDESFISGGTMVAGTVYVVSATTGRICPITDLAGGNYRITLGRAIDTTTLNLKVVQTGTTA